MDNNEIIASLKTLLDSGTISQEEYDKKVTELSAKAKEEKQAPLEKTESRSDNRPPMDLIKVGDNIETSYSNVKSMQGEYFAKGSPVSMEGYDLLKNKTTDKIFAQVIVKNISPKTISAVIIGIDCFDVTGAEIEKDYPVQYLDLKLERDETYGDKILIPLYDSKTRSLSVRVQQVLFSDGSDWKEGDCQWHPLPTKKLLAELPQYKDKAVAAKLTEQLGKDRIYQPNTFEDIWMCSCGAINREDEVCHVCGADQETIPQALSDENIEEIKKQVEIEEEEKKLQAEKELREKEEKKAKRAAAMKKARKTMIIVLVIVAAVIAAGVISSNIMDKGKIADIYEGKTNISSIHFLDVKVPKGAKVEQDATMCTYQWDKDIKGMFSSGIYYLGKAKDMTVDDVVENLDIENFSYDESPEKKNIKGEGYEGKVFDISNSEGEDATAGFCGAVKSDESIFALYFFALDDYYSDSAKEAFLSSINFKDYKTLELDSIDAKYEGETVARTVMTGDEAEGFKVNAHWKDKNGDEILKDITNECTIKGPYKLKPDKTSEYTVVYEVDNEEFKDTVKVECSTHVKKITVNYSGKTKAGVRINKNNSKLKVVAYYKDGTHETITDYTIKGRSKLRAGKTNTYRIYYGAAEATLKVKCTTLTAKQKRDKYINSCKDVSYSNLAHYPSKYEGDKIHIHAEVMQNIGDGNYLVYKDGDYDQLMYVNALFADTPGSNIIEDDYIDIYGTGGGDYTYETAMGASKTVPQIHAEYITK